MFLTKTFIVVWFALQVVASRGDRARPFQLCLSKCEAIEQDLSLALRLTRWSNSDLCKYECMHDITTKNSENGLPIQQYYGKWPFWRLGGIQEPASVLFSLLNLLLHTRGMARVRGEIPKTHPMKTYFILWSCASINTWIWSTMFHCRG